MFNARYDERVLWDSLKRGRLRSIYSGDGSIILLEHVRENVFDLGRDSG